MAIILLGNQKGGCGKSTTACNVASVLANQGLDVLLVDADQQITTSMWVASRRTYFPGASKIPSVQKQGNIDEDLLDLDRRYEYVIVDAAGHDSRELRSSLEVADIVLMPFRPSTPDLDTLPYMENLVTGAKRVNPKLLPLAFVNCAATSRRGQDVTRTRDSVASYAILNMMSAVLHDRSIFRDAMADGQGVCEFKDNSKSAKLGKQEIMDLVAEMLLRYGSYLH